ncbi:MAG: hypothetical protein MMC23_008596 [Stictis urceolatum]|nr:hypothetical protein [Stictis urceolata]
MENYPTYHSDLLNDPHGQRQHRALAKGIRAAAGAIVFIFHILLAAMVAVVLVTCVLLVIANILLDWLEFLTKGKITMFSISASLLGLDGLLTGFTVLAAIVKTGLKQTLRFWADLIL